MLPIIHYAHLLLGILYMGGTLTLSLVIYPGLARLPAADAARVNARIEAVGGPLLGAAGGMTLLLGPLRAWLSGNIASWGDLGQTYAHIVGTAFVVLLVIQTIDGRFRRKFNALTTNPAQFAARAPGLTLRTAVIEVALFLAILGMMVAMGLALY